MKVLALDIGSSAVKAGYWNGRRFAARARVEFRTEFEGVCAEAPAGRILSAVEHAGREVLRGSAAAVDVVSFCAFSSSVVITDSRGNIRVGAITHQDRRSVEEAGALTRRLGKKWFLEHTGNLPYPGGIGSSTLAWLRRRRPASLRGSCRVGQMSSLVGYMLTGQWTIDPSQAAFLGLWDIQKRAWSARLCEAVGVSAESLPRLTSADTVIGAVTALMARLWPAVREGTPVVGGFVDTSAAAIQTPMHAGQLVHNVGSTDVLAMCLDRPRPTEGILTRPLGVGERWLAVRTIAAAGSAIEWARRTLFSPLADGAWKRALRQAADHDSDAGTPTCVPHFSGLRTAIQQEAGARFSDITLATTREDLLAAIVRGLVAESVQSYRMLSAMRKPERTVYCMGGADVLGEAMRAAWPEKHVYRKLQGDSLAGLVQLAAKMI